jgi:hypothetical protein
MKKSRLLGAVRVATFLQDQFEASGPIFALRSLKAAAIVTLLTLGASTSAFAAFVSFDVTWSGASNGNGASATGFITFDDTLLPDVGSLPLNPLPNGAVTELGITVVGSTGGLADGTWEIGDFSNFYFATPVALNLGTELIGQSLGGGLVFGGDPQDGSTGDFNLFASTSGAPAGFNYFELGLDNGEIIRVTSMLPSAVPIPAAVWLFGSGLIGLVGIARRKKT